MQEVKAHYPNITYPIRLYTKGLLNQINMYVRNIILSNNISILHILRGGINMNEYKSFELLKKLYFVRTGGSKEEL